MSSATSASPGCSGGLSSAAATSICMHAWANAASSSSARASSHTGAHHAIVSRSLPWK